MSALPGRLIDPQAETRLAAVAGEHGPGTLPRAARVYAALVIAAAAAADGALYLHAPAVGDRWATLIALAVAATVAQALAVSSSPEPTYHTSVAFLVAAALLLPPELVVLIPLVQTVPAWLKERSPWSMPTFNAANYTLDALAAWATADAIEHHAPGLVADPGARFALGGFAACVVFVAVNHALLAGVLRAGRRRALRDGGLRSLESAWTDLVLAMLGVSLAAFWRWNPWLVFAALAPVLAVHRSRSVPQLREEARVDPKTGLYNARYFATALAAELTRAARFERPMALIMADLDLLRELNNTHGHLAGDAVLRGIADTFRSELRQYDVAARFGGEEFSILLPETSAEQALEIAERIRRAVAEREFHIATAPEPLRATLSMGVASYPKDGVDANELLHQADLAVYRAKLQGRNRVLAASAEPLLAGGGPGRLSARDGSARLRALPAADGSQAATPTVEARPVETEGQPRKHEPPRLRLLAPSGRPALLAAAVGVLGAAGGVAGAIFGGSTDVDGLLGLMVLVGLGEALSFELTEVAGSISVGVVGTLAGTALFDYRAALPLALAAAVGEWRVRRTSLGHVASTGGTIVLASLASAAVFSGGFAAAGRGPLAYALLGVLAGLVYFAIAMGLQTAAVALASRGRPWTIFRERCAWLLPHYLVYGAIGGVIAVAYEAVGLYALGVFVAPLLLMRKTHEAYLQHAERSAVKLREAAETIRAQNVSLEEANRLLRERSTAAMESLCAIVDARDAYTAGHSRRVQQLSLALGRELGLSQAELDVLGRAALFHDIGKLAVPDAILLKPGSLTEEEWALMRRHAEEGARIIERLGFLQDAVPAIRHHHERWDGGGYPGGLAGHEIPLGARIIHVADALDSMLTTRIYRSARSLEEALAEIRGASGTQFCSSCVAALERLLPLEADVAELGMATAVS